MTPRHPSFLLALVVVVAGCSNDPNPSMVEVARSLAPPETQIIDVGENTGSRMIVGDYFAAVETDDGGLSEQGLQDAVRAHAESEGWTLDSTEKLPFATRLIFSRDGLQARITVFEGGTAPHANITVSDD